MDIIIYPIVSFSAVTASVILLAILAQIAAD